MCSNLGDTTGEHPTDSVQEQVDVATKQAVNVAEANRLDAQQALDKIKDKITEGQA